MSDSHNHFNHFFFWYLNSFSSDEWKTVTINSLIFIFSYGTASKWFFCCCCGISLTLFWPGGRGALSAPLSTNMSFSTHMRCNRFLSWITHFFASLNFFAFSEGFGYPTVPHMVGGSRAPSLIVWKQQPSPNKHANSRVIMMLGNCNFTWSKINAICRIQKRPMWVEQFK